MDSRDPDISFDADGNCNYCNEYFRREPLIVHRGAEGMKRLEKIVEKIKAEGAGKEYDCILGVSGGVDSTYVAYWAHKLGLRPLAVHFDNGWNSELAVKNIENILNKLKIDLYTYVVDWEEFKDVQIPSDHGFLAVLYKIAEQKGIKYFLTGSNFTTEGILPPGYGYLSVDLRHIVGIHKKFGKVPMKTFPKLSLTKYFYYRFFRGLTKVPVLDYLDYNKSQAMQIIEKELDWRYYGGKHYESIYTRFFQSYILPKKFGIDKRKAHLSSLICSNQISRSEAIEELSRDPYPPELLRQDKEYVVKKIGVSEAEFDEIMSSPVKSHMEYPNNSRIFSVLSHLNAWRQRRNASRSARDTLTRGERLATNS
jgi:N-acetyl sugar amidotransferase